MQYSFTNQLIHETSPYLLQHAHNPVNWFSWGEEALQKAKEEDKIILVSIGYAACHWCHVMERESFEDEVTAEIMNRHFINIKIDREERPDIDHIYMDAVQAMTGAGGWPLNVFLTPDKKPFYGGTYFPPVRAFNRSSWKEVLYGVSEAWQQRRNEVEAQAIQLTEHLQQSNDFGQTKPDLKLIETGELFSADQCKTMFSNIMKAADKTWGGFGNAPKFPQTFTIQYLLQYYRFSGDQAALDQAQLSLDKMMEGGIYDHAGGGFSRYSTDAEWLAPHFEKMLYDNALLLIVLSDAYALTKQARYAKTIRQTMAFLQREMMDAGGGFYAALDADSEGKEGKFYVWDKTEIESLLKEQAPVFCKFFDVTEKGNWEGKNILRTLKNYPDFAAENNIDPSAFEVQMEQSLTILLDQRTKRVRPSTDDKILLGWNALLITAICKAGAALGEESYKKLAVETFEFVWNRFRKNDSDLLHTYKNELAKYPAFLDDYAYLIQSCIHLQEISSDQGYLQKAKELTERVLASFTDDESSFLFYTPKDQADIIVRKKEVYDGATPSGNSIMTENLWYLGIVFDKPEWIQRSHEMLAGLSAAVVKHPSSFGVWCSAILKQVMQWNEIAITGPEFADFRNEILKEFIPNKIVQSSFKSYAEFPLLASKNPEGDTHIYLCKNYACLSPFTTVEALLNAILKKPQNLTGTAQ